MHQDNKGQSVVPSRFINKIKTAEPIQSGEMIKNK
jgi:hypothetical protein